MLLTYQIYEAEKNIYNVYYIDEDENETFIGDIQTLVEEIVDIAYYEMEDDDIYSIIIKYNPKDENNDYDSMVIDDLRTYLKPKYLKSFEEYSAELWDDYYKQYNPKFYYNTFSETIEDSEGHLKKFKENLEKTFKEYTENFEAEMKERDSMLKEEIEKKFNINAPIYIFDLEKHNEPYYSWNNNRVVILKDIVTKEEETIILKYDYEAISDEKEYPFEFSKFHIYGPNYEKIINPTTKYTKKEANEIRKEIEHVQNSLTHGSDNLFLVDIQDNGYVYKLSFGTEEQLDNAWGDDYDDAPYQHNAGPVYEEYVTETIEWKPKDNLMIQSIENYLNTITITKSMILRGILPAYVVTFNSYDIYRKNEHPIFIGKSQKEIYNTLKKIS